MAQITVGAWVQLKSGGPVMTVEELVQAEDNGTALTRASCIWLDASNQLAREVFDCADLAAIEEPRDAFVNDARGTLST